MIERDSMSPKAEEGECSEVGIKRLGGTVRRGDAAARRLGEARWWDGEPPRWRGGEPMRRGGEM